MNISADYPQRCRDAAYRLYLDVQLNCAESVFKAMVESMDVECPVETLRLASGLGGGIGRAGCSCGCILGATMVMGMVFGRTESTGHPPKVCMAAAHRLHDEFRASQGSTCCRILHKGLDFGTKEQRLACADRAAFTAELAAKIIMDELAKAKAE